VKLSEYAWKEFSQPAELRHNLERYGLTKKKELR